jgi:hypothetical protein
MLIFNNKIKIRIILFKIIKTTLKVRIILINKLNIEII